MRKTLIALLVAAMVLMVGAVPALASPPPPVPVPVPVSAPIPAPRPKIDTLITEFTTQILVREFGTETWMDNLVIQPDQNYEVQIQIKNVGNTAGKMILNVGLSRYAISSYAANTSSTVDIRAIVNRLPVENPGLSLLATEDVTIYIRSDSAKVYSPVHPNGVALEFDTDAIFSGLNLGVYVPNESVEITFAFQAASGVRPHLPKTEMSYECELDEPTLTADGVRNAHYFRSVPGWEGTPEPNRLAVLREIYVRVYPDSQWQPDEVIMDCAVSSGLIVGRGDGDYAWKETASQAEIYTILANYARVFLGVDTAVDSCHITIAPRWAWEGIALAYESDFFFYDYDLEAGMPYGAYLHILNDVSGMFGGGMG